MKEGMIQRLVTRLNTVGKLLRFQFKVKNVSSKIWFFQQIVIYPLYEKGSRLMNRKNLYYTSGIAATAMALMVAHRIFRRSQLTLHAN